MPERYLRIKQPTKHPLAIGLLALSAISGFPSAIGNYPPTSLSQLLPGWMIIVWGILLTVGSAIALVGIFLQNKHPRDGLVAEQIGLAVAGNAGLLFVVCAFLYAGLSATLGAGVVGVFGGFLLWRWIQIQVFFRTLRKTELEAKVRRGISDDSTPDADGRA